MRKWEVGIEGKGVDRGSLAYEVNLLIFCTGTLFVLSALCCEIQEVSKGMGLEW